MIFSLHVVWDGRSESDSNLLESLQIEGACKGCSRCLERDKFLNELSWVDLSVRRKLHKVSLLYKMVFKVSP